MRTKIFDMTPKQALRARRAMTVLYYIIAIIVAVIVIYPILVLIINTTRSSNDIAKGFSFQFGDSFIHNLTEFFNQSSKYNVPIAFLNSCIISFLSTAVCIYFSAMTAYACHVYNFKGKAFFEKFIVFLIIIPTTLAGVGFYKMVHYVMARSEIFSTTYLIYSIFILPAIASASTVYYIKQYMQSSFSLEYVDAARMDGASEIQIFNTICLPFIKSALATMALFGIIASWNNFMGPLTYLNGKKDFYTFPMIAYFLSKQTNPDMGVQYMGIFITMLPMLIVYACLSRVIMKGTAAGGIK